jgi:poly-gamma-glutamate capsule biosynthesis protein CapA/YwtB (metallophosphatase superfamily)
MVSVANKNGTTRMLLVGDVNAAQHPDGLQFLLAKAAPELKQGEIVYGNLEFPITDRGQFDTSKFWTKGRAMKPEDAGALSEAGFSVVSLANNHVMDFGADGLLQTIELLDSKGVAHCGGGHNLSEARKPAIVEQNGVRVAFLSYTSVFAASFRATENRPGMATVRINVAFVPHVRTFEAPGSPPDVMTMPDQQDLDAMRADVRQAKANADMVVVAWHWGVSRGYRKRVSYQMECGRAAIDAGASMIIGHHPHTLQGVEVYKKGVIIYSVADFAFWAGEPPGVHHDRDTVLVDCQIDKTGIRGMALRPLRINPETYQPELVRGSNGTRSLDHLVKDSQEFGTKLRDEGDRLVVDLAN